MIPLTRRTALTGAAALAATPALAAPRAVRAFVGTFTYAAGDRYPTDFGTVTGSRGIYSFLFDSRAGRISELGLAAEVRHPGNLIAHPGGRFLYACQGQDFRIDGQNAITAFRVEGARLVALNTVPCGGGGPTHGVVDSSGRNLLTTNFATSSVVCFRLNADGSIGERTAFIGKPPQPRPAAAAAAAGAPPAARRENPNARAPGERSKDPSQTKPHTIILTRSERYAIVAEIDSDRCSVYRFDAGAGSLTPHSVAASEPGSGPRHLAFEPSHRFLYSSDEAGSSITAWAWNEAKGEMRALQRLSTIPADFDKTLSHPADVVVHPSGRFVYVSNRGHPSLAGFRIDPATGTLTPLPLTPLPVKASWCLVFDPTGRWALVTLQPGGAVVVYKVDLDSGALTLTDQSAAVAMPTCITLI